MSSLLLEYEYSRKLAKHEQMKWPSTTETNFPRNKITFYYPDVVQAFVLLTWMIAEH